VVLDRLAVAEARAKTVASEMKHRVQNNLTLVQAIVRQTFRNSDNLAQAQKLLTARLAALARAHDLMEDFTDQDIQLEKLIRTALEPFDLQQFVLAGPPSVIVPEDFVLPLLLLIHELATNAAKYGALSNSAGRVEISWAEEPANHKVSLNWKERHGPPVGQPSRVGFGSRLLRAAFAQQGADASIAYEADGVRCAVAFSTIGQTIKPKPAADLQEQTADNGDYSISPNGSDPSEKQVRGAIGYPAAGLDKLGTFARPPH
jgi:two-component sensor histidine kinase